MVPIKGDNQRTIMIARMSKFCRINCMIIVLFGMMRIRANSLLAFAVFAFLCTGHTVSAQKIEQFDATSSLETNIDQSLVSIISELGPGATIKIAYGNKVIFDKSYGLAELKEQLPQTSSTSFYLASVSKQFTSMAIMLLKEKGLLNYNDTLDRYFPEAPKHWQSITIHNLLTHQSGIPDYYEPLGDQVKGITNDSVFRWAISQGNPEFEPGTQVLYSNTGYIILALLVEHVSGVPIEIFMHDAIFEPAGMHQTSVYNEDTPREKIRAIGYNANNQIFDYDAYTVGAGGIYSTAADLLKWSKAIDTNLLISANAFEIATRRHVDDFGGGYGYGYGWVLSEKNGDKILIHTGGYGGFYTLISKIPATGMTIIILANDGKFWPLNLHNQIVDYLYDTSGN